MKGYRQEEGVDPSRIVIGDAPVQGCALERIATQERTSEWRRLCGGIPLEILDFRRTIVRDGDLVRGLTADLRPMARYVLFDLGTSSLLEPVSTPRGSFRVTQYDPRKLALAHRSGKHQYLIAKEALEADVVLNVPKLKTHKKAGITAGLKNLVGINGNKDFLPHHRIGGSLLGGDCYEGIGPLKRAAEFCLDRANRRLGSPAYSPWARRASRLMDCQERLTGLADLEGSWHGNDTVWRTVLDLNRILVYGGADGTMASSPRRSVHTITDAIVCGQGEGPLAPSPAPLGAITFSSSPVAADRVHCALLRLDPERIPMVREASGEFRWPLAPGGSALEIRYRGRSLSLEEVARELGTTARAPKGWAGRVEWPSAPETTPAFHERT